MAYIVTFNGGDIAAIDQEFSLADALAHAFHLLQEGRSDVAIQDGSGRHVRGDDLVACIEGRKQLTADLRAV